MYDFDRDDHKRTPLIDWRRALKTPTAYRVGNTVRIQPHFIVLIVVMALYLLMLLYYSWWTTAQRPANEWAHRSMAYNNTYPLTKPVVSGDFETFRIGIVTDLDTASKSSKKPNAFHSYLKKGRLTYNRVKKTVTVVWDEQTTLLTSLYSHKGRGMELSELIVYNGKILTFDDRSGMVYEVFNDKMVPWLVLTDGNGHVEKGFKSEWAAVKDEILYIGSMGKEWTTANGEFQSHDPMWVKAVNMYGELQHLNWVEQYKAVRSSIGIQWPGYMIHESGVWSHIKKLWHFLPRRCSTEPYNETKDEVMGCNYLITADEDFKVIKATKITKLQPKLGFSSFKFIPGSNDEAIVALKTTEFEGNTATYITAFTTDGVELLPDTLIENLKYEGIEFI